MLLFYVPTIMIYHKTLVVENFGVDSVVHDQSSNVFYAPTIFILVNWLCKAANHPVFWAAICQTFYHQVLHYMLRTSFTMR